MLHLDPHSIEAEVLEVTEAIGEFWRAFDAGPFVFCQKVLAHPESADKLH